MYKKCEMSERVRERKRKRFGERESWPSNTKSRYRREKEVRTFKKEHQSKTKMKGTLFGIALILYYYYVKLKRCLASLNVRRHLGLEKIIVFDNKLLLKISHSVLRVDNISRQIRY